MLNEDGVLISLDMTEVRNRIIGKTWTTIFKENFSASTTYIMLFNILTVVIFFHFSNRRINLIGNIARRQNEINSVLQEIVRLNNLNLNYGTNLINSMGNQNPENNEEGNVNNINENIEPIIANENVNDIQIDENNNFENEIENVNDISISEIDDINENQNEENQNEENTQINSIQESNIINNENENIENNENNENNDNTIDHDRTNTSTQINRNLESNLEIDNDNPNIIRIILNRPIPNNDEFFANNPIFNREFNRITIDINQDLQEISNQLRAFRELTGSATENNQNNNISIEESSIEEESKTNIISENENENENRSQNLTKRIFKEIPIDKNIDENSDEENLNKYEN